MTFKNVFVLCGLFTSLMGLAQNDETLFSIDGEPVKSSEFLRVYNKNLDIVTDENQKEIKNYLDLYVNYKLKIAQARELGYDTLTAYKKELNTYKKQLMEPYLKDDAFVANLVKEAYDRSLIEVSASHILVKLTPLSKDTLRGYTKINEVRSKLLNGDPFDAVAKQYSEDPSAQTNGGNLGYFSVFNMVYPFESAAYNTEIGAISTIFKTRFGYHIIKVNDKRAARGEVEAAHIMVKGDSLASKTKIDEIYKLVLQGDAPFEKIARTQSEDDFTAKKGGSLGRFGSGKMVKEFEEQSFALKNEGDISQPFKSQYGWHIIKLIKKYPVASFEAQEKELTNRVKRGDRASIVSNSIVHKIKDNYSLKVVESALAPFKSQEWKIATKLDKTLLILEDTIITQNALKTFLAGSDFSMALFNKFKNRQILEHYKAHLEETNQEFANIYKEYKEGLLLFELLQEKIWDKSKDSIGLQTYYKSFKDNYKQPKSFIGSIATCTTEKVANTVKMHLEEQISTDSIKKLLNTKEKIHVVFRSGKFDTEDVDLPTAYAFSKGISEIFKTETVFIVINAAAITPESFRKFDEIRGLVSNDYQEYLEKQWIEELHNTYTVVIDESVVNKLVENNK